DAFMPPPLEPPPRRPRPPDLPPLSPRDPAVFAQSVTKPTSSGFTVRAGFRTHTPAMLGVLDWIDVKAVKRRKQKTPSDMLTNSFPTVPQGCAGDARRRIWVVLAQPPRHRSEV